MRIQIFPDAPQANGAAADCLALWLTQPATRNVMVASGATPLELYRLIAARRLDLSRLNIFALDEYVGVPLDEPRNCANVLRRSVADAWRVPPEQFFAISSIESEGLASAQHQERHIAKNGGLDVVILGLGQNGHLGFNEPGSPPDCPARLLALEPVSVEANRKWFNGDYAPTHGVTVGLKTILAARQILLLAFGAHKTTAVTAMARGPRSPLCPASFLQGHGDVQVFLDELAARGLAAHP